ncbi:hypothetical protein K1719_029896 [Acacia pycnantha]|nr:hypothetical protein K1719_029896 [Acacia pycnantha]
MGMNFCVIFKVYFCLIWGDTRIRLLFSVFYQIVVFSQRSVTPLSYSWKILEMNDNSMIRCSFKKSEIFSSACLSHSSWCRRKSRATHTPKGRKGPMSLLGIATANCCIIYYSLLQCYC